MAGLPNKVQKFTKLETDFGTSISQALWLKAAQLCEYVNKSYPVGMLMYFDNSLSNLPSRPDPKYWQFADGSAVTNPLSPMFGYNLPDLRGRFIKHPTNGLGALVESGQNSITTYHDHGGQTGIGTDWDSVRLDNGQEMGQAIGGHQHAIFSTAITTSTVPAHLELQIYIRIV